MNPANERPRDPLSPGEFSIDSKKIDKLKTKIEAMQLELNVLRETIQCIKKRPMRCIDPVKQSGKGSDHRRPEK